MTGPGTDSAAAAKVRSAVRHLRITTDNAGQRLDRLLARLLPGVPRSRLFRLIRRGEVRVNGRRAGPELRVAEGDTLRLPPLFEAPAQPHPPAVPRSLIQAVERAVLHEEERFLVLDKPAGLAVHGGSGLSFGVIEALRASRPLETLELAHRLDRDTSGCLLIARRRSALRILHALLRTGAVRKSYLALLAGSWPGGRRRVDARLRTDGRVGGERTVRVAADGVSALTEFLLLETFGEQASLVEVRLHTGRTHQIRVHAAHLGHPVLGDPKYGSAAANAAMAALGLRRMFLHAHRIAFTWTDGSEHDFSAPLSPALSAVLERVPGRRPAARRAADGVLRESRSRAGAARGPDRSAADRSGRSGPRSRRVRAG